MSDDIQRKLLGIKAGITKEKFCVSISFPDQLMQRKCVQEFSVKAALLQLRKWSQISTNQALIPFQRELFEHNGRGENKCESWHIRGYFEAKLSNMNQSLLFNMTDIDKEG